MRFLGPHLVAGHDNSSQQNSKRPNPDKLAPASLPASLPTLEASPEPREVARATRLCKNGAKMATMGALLESVVPARALRAAVGRHHGAGVARLFVSCLVSSTSAGRTHSLTTVFGRRQTSHAQPAVAARRRRRRAARRTVAVARRRVCGRKRGIEGAEALLRQ